MPVRSRIGHRQLRVDPTRIAAFAFRFLSLPSATAERKSECFRLTPPRAYSSGG